MGIHQVESSKPHILPVVELIPFHRRRYSKTLLSGVQFCARRRLSHVSQWLNAKDGARNPMTYPMILSSEYSSSSPTSYFLFCFALVVNPDSLMQYIS